MKFKTLIASIFLTVLFYVLFYKQEIGMNLLVFELILLGISLIVFTSLRWTIQLRIILCCTVISAFFVLLYGSNIAIAVNLTCLLMLVAYRIVPEFRSALNAFVFVLFQFQRIPANLLNLISFGNKPLLQRMSKTAYHFRVILPAIILVFVFLILYIGANSRFKTMVQSLMTDLGNALAQLFTGFSWNSLFVILIGLCVSSVFIFHHLNGKLQRKDQMGNDHHTRKHSLNKGFTAIDLKKEHQSMVFLLCILNVLILILNIIDIDWVWLNYRWEGEELKEFVHQGTYILLLAILLSCGISLYIFRNNLNHYQQNRWLKNLTYAWIIQNMVMTFSVGMRTYRYIEHFNLAHLRIGLLYFLLASIMFMVFIILKIHGRRSRFYLIRYTAVSTFLIFFMLCPFDWDRLIVAYNFKHSDKAYVHKDWTMTLSDKTLPIIGEHMDFMQGGIDSNSWHSGKANDYKELYEKRVKRFIVWYEKKHPISINMAEHSAYLELKKRPFK